MRKKAQCLMVFCRFWPIYCYMEGSYLLVNSEQERTPRQDRTVVQAAPQLELAENSVSGICDGKDVTWKLWQTSGGESQCRCLGFSS